MAVHCETLIWNPGWNRTRNVVYNSRIETDIRVHALSVTKSRIFSLLWVKQHRASDRSRRKKLSFAGFLERFAKKSADIAGISLKFSGLTSPKNNREKRPISWNFLDKTDFTCCQRVQRFPFLRWAPTHFASIWSLHTFSAFRPTCIARRLVVGKNSEVSARPKACSQAID